ncbi:hypothetical protein HK096_010416 [Nowakowskiella sp. JEL0078]|nr:hypothetical protein HK096_010416 [Nowakowskiella sp. JEL0078]
MTVENSPKAKQSDVDFSTLLNAAAVVSATASSTSESILAPVPCIPLFPISYERLTPISKPQLIPSPPISTVPVAKTRRRCEGVDKVCNMDAVPGRRFCRVCQKRSTNKMREQHIQSLEDQLRAAGVNIAQLTAQQRALRSFQIMAKRLRFSSIQPTIGGVCSKDELSDDVLREVHSFLKLFSSYSTFDNTTCATPQTLVMQQTRHPTDALVALLNLGCETRRQGQHPLSPASSHSSIVEQIPSP